MPAAGPATSNVVDQTGSTAPPIAVVNVDAPVLAVQTRRPQPSLYARFGTGTPRPDLRIAPGDTVSVTVWEAPPGSLFSSTILSSQGTTSSGSAVIAPQTVGADGTIGVPYAGRLRVVGSSAAQAERAIVAALLGKTVQPQALVIVQKSAFNAVTVTGEVAGGARIALSAGGERILDAIAAAGGLRASVHESIIELTRNRLTARARFESIVQSAHENIYLRPGDVVTVIREPRTFTVLGATERNADIPFDAQAVSMSEALAKAGGLQDNRADAAGVFLFRREVDYVARRVLPPGSPYLNPTGPTPIVYRFDLSDSKTILAMNQFMIEPKDIIYVSNASSVEIAKILNIFQGVAGPALTATAVGISAR